MYYVVSVTMVCTYSIEADSEDEAESLVQREIPRDADVIAVSVEEGD